MGRHDGKRPIGNPTRRREDNIKMNLEETEDGGHGLD